MVISGQSMLVNWVQSLFLNSTGQSLQKINRVPYRPGFALDVCLLVMVEHCANPPLDAIHADVGGTYLSTAQRSAERPVASKILLLARKKVTSGGPNQELWKLIKILGLRTSAHLSFPRSQIGPGRGHPRRGLRPLLSRLLCTGRLSWRP